jgi:hypothetical protein
MLLVQIHDEVGLWRIGMVQPETDRTHAELPNEDSLLLGAGDCSWKLEDKAVGILCNLNRRDNRRAQSDFDANLAVGRKNLNLAHFAWTRVGGSSREYRRQDQERSQIDPPLHTPSSYLALSNDLATFYQRKSMSVSLYQFLWH